MRRYNFKLWSPASSLEYKPIHPRGMDWRGFVRKVTTPFVFLIGLLAKLGSLAKFAAIFIAFGGYALIWGWRFGLGVVVLDLCARDGPLPRSEARRAETVLARVHPISGRLCEVHARQIRGRPHASRSPGRIFGGVAALGCYLVARSDGSNLLLALAYFGFFLNLINLLPFAILDGAAVSGARLGSSGSAAGRNMAIISGGLYAATAIGLAIGMYAAYLPQHRL